MDSADTCKVCTTSGEPPEQTIKETDYFALAVNEEGAQFYLRGDWTILNLDQLEDIVDLRTWGVLEVVNINFRCGGLQQFDLSGAWLLYRTAERFRELGYIVDFQGFRAEHMQFIDDALEIEKVRDKTPARQPLMWRYLERSANAIHDFYQGIRQRAAWWWLVSVAGLASLRNPSRFRWIATARHISDAGINAVGIVTLMAFLVAIVLSFQSQSQLVQFGAQIFTVDLVSLSILREMGGLLTAILVAGRSGSAFAAEIGVMRLNEELDAMKTMGIDPIDTLVIPRMMALVICLPLLTFIADIAGLLGTLAITSLMLDIPTGLATDRLLSLDPLQHFGVGMIKAPVFALAIGMIGTYRGYYVEDSADAVGRNTTSAVVESIFTVIVIDALFSILFTELGW